MDALDALTAVRGAVDRLPTGALGPLLELLAEDVAFEVAGGDGPGRGTVSGRQAVADYFAALGGLMAFWQMEYSATGGRVIAWVTESFTLAETGLEGEAELALVLDFRLGRVARLSVIEDLSFLPGWDGAGGRPAVVRSKGRVSNRQRDPSPPRERSGCCGAPESVPPPAPAGAHQPSGYQSVAR